MAKPKKKFIKKLKSKFRLSLLREASYEEQFSLLLTPLNVILLLLAVFIIIGGITYSVTALTPLRQYVVPGYADDQLKEDARLARAKADSLDAILKTQENYLRNLQLILSGEVPVDSLSSLGENVPSADLSYDISEEDSLLRAQVAEEDRFALRVGTEENTTGLPVSGFLFKPVDGSISSLFDADIEHFGIDLVASENSVVKAVLPGSVILASFTSDGGNVIALQHENNLISVYKHNSALYKEVGETVKAGESIAVIGNTGDHSDGPHLHFELWVRGSPVDPLQYLVFEE